MKSPLGLFSFVLCLLISHFSAAEAPQSVKSGPSSTLITIVFVGDSLTAGFGVKKEESYPEVVGQILKQKLKQDVKILNGGISGSVTAEADRRVRWFLKSKPEILVLALGANDGLKGTPVSVIKKNLAQAIDLAKANHVKVLLAGMRLFENFGAEYTRTFAALYPELAKEKRVALMPFLLVDVALDKSLNQSDGKHPNAKGHEIIAKNVARELEKLL